MSFYSIVLHWLAKWQRACYLDFGSSQCRLLIGSQLVWDQPSLVVWDSRKKIVIAIGHQAAAYQGRSPTHLMVFSPIVNGVIANLDLAQAYLEILLSTVKKKQLGSFLPLRCNYLVPCQTTVVEEKHFVRVITQVGLIPDKKIELPLALSNLAILNSIPQVQGVISMGDQTVNLGIIAAKQLILEKKLTIGVGKDFTLEIIDKLKKSLQLQVSLADAQKIKHQLGNLLIDQKKKNLKLTVRGKGESRVGLVSITVQTNDITNELVLLADKLIKEIELFLTELSPEIFLQIQEHGLFLTGGASLLNGWKNILESRLGLPIIMSENPYLDGVRGLASNQSIV